VNYRAETLSPGLYLVATPIGTARDITLRALDTLASADVLVAEDTRSLKHLMAIHGIPLGDRPVRAYHDHSDAAARAKIIAAVSEGRSVAYASEAGTPLISDPGFALLRDAVAAGIAVTSVPGASAAVTALTLAGLPTDRFLFLGFPPAKAKARRDLVARFGNVPATLVFYESPRRVHDLLADLAAGLGPDREAALCRELTKRFEEVLRAPLGVLVADLAARDLKGECVVLVGPPPATDEPDAGTLRDAVATALASGATVRDAASDVAARFGVPRKTVYGLALDLERGRS